jgi:hypothetical protein
MLGERMCEGEDVKDQVAALDFERWRYVPIAVNLKFRHAEMASRLAVETALSYAADAGSEAAADAVGWKAADGVGLQLDTGGRKAVDEATDAERLAQVSLLHDIFGNPFRPVQDAPWLCRNDRTLGPMARAIYEERRFADLPVLADALEDAGCTDPAVLDHCRGPGPHVRGCWVVDLVMGAGVVGRR